MRKQKQSTIAVRVNGRDYEKPFDRGCGACTSPWLAEIDEGLAAGHSYSLIRDSLKGRRPPCPPIDVIAVHVGHLAAPHMAQRREMERHYRESGGDPAEGYTINTVRGMTQLILQRGMTRMASGDIEPESRDVLAALKIQARLDEQAAGERNAAGDAAVWEQAFIEFFDIVRGHLDDRAWDAFLAEVNAAPAVAALRLRKHQQHEQPAVGAA